MINEVVFIPEWDGAVAREGMEYYIVISTKSHGSIENYYLRGKSGRFVAVGANELISVKKSFRKTAYEVSFAYA